jgi:hypothetical protein
LADGRPPEALRHAAGFTSDQLAEEDGVDPRTIQRDGAFTEATDVLEQEVREDLRQAVLQRQVNTEKGRSMKGQVIQAGQALKERRLETKDYMCRADWKDYQVDEAITLLDGLTLAEQDSIARLLDCPYIPPDIGLQIARNLAEATPSHRQQIDQLQPSENPREQSLAMTLAAKKPPEPDPRCLWRVA